MIRENIRDNILRCSNLPAIGWRQGTRGLAGYAGYAARVTRGRPGGNCLDQKLSWKLS